MECKNDIILEHHEKGLCPICLACIGSDFKTTEYKGRKVWICKEHHVDKKLNENDIVNNKTDV